MICEETVYYRVVVVGDSAVGKTSIITRVVNGRFSLREPPTSGSSFLIHRLRTDGGMVNLQIWDTAGQERYRSLGPIYYRNADVGLIVFSLADKESSENIESWYESFSAIAGTDTLTYVVANKKDLDEGIVDMESVRRWADEHGLLVFETSALSGDGISELFKEIGEGIIRKGAAPKSIEDQTPTEASQAIEQKSCC